MSEFVDPLAGASPADVDAFYTAWDSTPTKASRRDSVAPSAPFVLGLPSDSDTVYSTDGEQVFAKLGIRPEIDAAIDASSLDTGEFDPYLDELEDRFRQNSSSYQAEQDRIDRMREELRDMEIEAELDRIDYGDLSFPYNLSSANYGRWLKDEPLIDEDEELDTPSSKITAEAYLEDDFVVTHSGESSEVEVSLRDRIALGRINDFIARHGSVERRRDSKQRGQSEAIYSSHTQAKREADYFADVRENLADAAILSEELGLQKGSAGSEVPSIPDNMLAKLIAQVKRSPKA